MCIRDRLRAKIIEEYVKEIPHEGFERAYKRAKNILGSPRVNISDEDYARFLAEAYIAIEELAKELAGNNIELAKKVKELVNQVLKTGGVSIASYRKTIDLLAEIARYAEGDKGRLELVAMSGELVDTALAIELISKARSWREVWAAVATFFDKTLNIHIFDYKPYLYTRASFAKDKEFRDVFTRKEIFELMSRRYRWLYEYIKTVLTSRTELRLLDQEDLEKLLNWGTEDDPKAKEEGYLEASKLVFKYARLRDLATL